MLFVNTPMKVMNPDYTRIDTVPLNLALRGEIGTSIETNEIDRIPEVIDDLISKSSEYKEKITNIYKENVFNIGKSAEVGGKYIIDTIQEHIRDRKRRENNEKNS